MLCDYYPVLYYLDITNHVNYLDICQKYSCHPKARIILYIPAANQSLHYNTTQALIV